MSLRNLLVFVILLAGAFGLAYTNPSSEDYQHYQDQIISDTMSRILEADTGTKRSVLQQLVKNPNSTFLRSLFVSQTVRHNYGLFSVFDTRVFQTHVRVLGAGGIFIPLTNLDKAMKEVEQSIVTPAG